MAIAASKYETCEFEELADATQQLSALQRHVRVEELLLIRELATHDESLAQDGARDVARWLCMRTGISLRTAQELQDVAKATAQLPCIFEAFVEGLFSWDKLVLVCTFATSETDKQFAAECPTMDMRQLRMLSKKAQRAKEDEVVDLYEARYLRLQPTRGGKAGRITGFLPIEQFAVIQKQIELIGDNIGPNHLGEYPSADHRNADALAEICSTQLAQSSDAHRASVVIEGDISMLTGITSASIEGIGIVSDETVRRILCSASVELTILEDGKTIGSGRKTRLFPIAVVKALRRRDRGCRFPGCERRRWLESHHIEEWGKDCGESNEDNGLTLCSLHHLFVHEKRWQIDGNPYGALTFVDPCGNRFTGMPPSLRPEIAAKFPLTVSGG